MASDFKREDAASLAAVAARFGRIRAGVDVGFDDPAVSAALRAAHEGVWMTVACGETARTAAAAALDPKTVLLMGTGGEMPFEDLQFDVVVLATALFAESAILPTLVREAHRVLQGGGCLVFTVDEATAGGDGWTQRAIYELLRDGFDVEDLKRPAWWRFGSAGRTLTVCARRKNWRNRGVPIVGASMPVSSAMLSPRDRAKETRRMP